MKATLKTKVVKCEGKKFQGYHYSVSVICGDFSLLYLTTAEDQETSRDCLTSITCDQPYVNYSYNKDSAEFWRVNGDKVDPEMLQNVAAMCDGLPIIYPHIPEGMQAAETVTNTYKHELIDNTPSAGAVLSVFVTNLGMYNEGALVGMWLDLPATDDEIEKAMKRIGICSTYEEYFLTDWEGKYSGLTEMVGEYSNLTEVNEAAQRLAELDDDDLEVLGVMLENGYGTFDECLQKVEYRDFIIYDNCQSLEDVAYYVIDSSGILAGANETLGRYFDYKAYGRDLGIMGNFYMCDDYYLEVLN